jgi:hypothetical protein
MTCIGRDWGILNFVPPWSCRKSIPASIRTSLEKGGVLTSALNHTRGLSPQFVFDQYQLKQVGSQSPRGKSTHEDVCVEENLQERALKISSSVSSPCASAKGSVRRRNSRNRSTASWRLSASRARSLLLRPVDLASRSCPLQLLVEANGQRGHANELPKTMSYRQPRSSINRRRFSD